MEPQKSESNGYLLYGLLGVMLAVCLMACATTYWYSHVNLNLLTLFPAIADASNSTIGKLTEKLTQVEAVLLGSNDNQTEILKQEVRNLNSTIDELNNKLDDLQESQRIVIYTGNGTQVTTKGTQVVISTDDSKQKREYDKFKATATPKEYIKPSDMETRNFNNYTELTGNYTRCFKDRWNNSTVCFVPID